MIRPVRQALLRALIASVALGWAILLPVGCDMGSSDSTTATLSDNTGHSYDFSGHYANHNGTGEAMPLVYPSGRQSGQTLMWLRLLQSGSVIEAYDNAGQTWSGSISSIANGTAQFTLRGRTSAGASVEIVGSPALRRPQFHPGCRLDRTQLRRQSYGLRRRRPPHSPCGAFWRRLIQRGW